MPELPTASSVSSGHHTTLIRAAPPLQAPVPATPVTPIQILLRAFSAGAEIRATVGSQDARGVTELKTDAGTIVVQSPVRLPVGSNVSLRIDTSGPEPRVLITRSADRTLVQDHSRLIASELAPEAPASAGALLRPAPPVTVDHGRSAIARAIVLGSPPPVASPDPPLAAPASASPPPNAVAVVSAATPVGAASPSSGIVAPPATTAGLPAKLAPANTPSLQPSQPVAAGAPSAAAAAITESNLQSSLRSLSTAASGALSPDDPPLTRGPLIAPGAELAVRIIGTAALHVAADDDAFTPRSVATASGPAARPGPMTIHATVEGFLPRGEAMLRTDFGRLAVHLPTVWAHIQTGESLAIELLPPSMANAGQPPVPLERSMPALRGLEAALIAGQMPADALGLPRPGPRLARQMIRFVEGVRAGSAESIFGPQETHSPSGDALKPQMARASAELREIADPQDQPRDWRLVLLPLMTEAGMVPLKFFSRRQAATQSRVKTEDAARFVIECDHKGLGAVAIDGLVHGKRIDVVLKTEARMGDEPKRDLLALFDDAVAAMGYAGALRFQDDAPVARIPLGVTKQPRLGLTA